MQDFNPHDPHGLDAMRFEIRETLSALDEGMLKKILEMLNAPVTFEYRDYSRALSLVVTFVHGAVTWHVKGTLWQIEQAIEGAQTSKPVEATYQDLTIMQLCDSEIGQALHLTYEGVMRGLGWSNWDETLYGLPPHADDAIHRLTAY